MEVLKLDKISKILSGRIQISGSKSETNRLLILQQFYPNLKIKNGSNSDDTKLLEKALQSNSSEINIGHAGTAMRFLTAFFAVTENYEVVLTGSERMKERPIKILVDALNSLGANIIYLEKEGFPPLKIFGKKLNLHKVEIEGSVSSQYISALLLIAPQLSKGLEITFKGAVTSIPYIKMTLELLSGLGIKSNWNENKITILPKPQIENTVIEVESDWSSASYFYSMVALQKKAKVTLSTYKKKSLQGDSTLAEIYKKLGVETLFFNNSIQLRNTNKFNKQPLILDLKDTPDIAQTIAVTCFGLGIACNLIGLHTLKIKETDRLVALKTELEKLGATVLITDKSLHLKSSSKIFKNVSIATYHDHRMAMAFTPLALFVPIQIQDANVVSKSYPQFWDDFLKITG